MRFTIVFIGALGALSLGCSQQKASSPPLMKAQAPAGRDEAAKENAAAESTPRKIIFTAHVDLSVSDFDKSVDDLNQLAAQHKAYIANSNIIGSVGTPRTGTWTVRVPVDKFPEFLAAANKLGELHSTKTDSEDITDMYYDLKAHIKTNKVEEETLQKILLEKAPGSKLEDLVSVRRELRTIRTESEQQEGRLQRWDKETSFSTVTITMNDRFGFVPANAPAFGTTVGRTFGGSIDVMLTVAKGIVLMVVALAPWLLLFAIAGVPTFFLIRRKMRLAKSPPPPTKPPAPPQPPTSGDAPVLSPA